MSARTASRSPRANASYDRAATSTLDIGLEVELFPGVPPRVGAGDDRPGVDALHAVAVAEPVGLVGVLVLGPDLARPAGIVGRDGLQVAERLLRRLLDELPRAGRRQRTRGLATEAPLHGRHGEPVAEEFPA